MSLYDDVFRALADAQVRYVVVGGVAVVLRGHARLTVDLDLVLDLERENATRAVDAMLGCGLLPRLPVDAHQFADPDVRADWVANRNLMVFSFYDPDDPVRVLDVFAQDPMPFAELAEGADDIVLDRARVPVASVRDLIAMKRTAGRPKDLEDIAALERMMEP